MLLQNKSILQSEVNSSWTTSQSEINEFTRAFTNKEDIIASQISKLAPSSTISQTTENVSFQNFVSDYNDAFIKEHPNPKEVHSFHKFASEKWKIHIQQLNSFQQSIQQPETTHIIKTNQIFSNHEQISRQINFKSINDNHNTIPNSSNKQLASSKKKSQNSSDFENI
jgi:hypothetical protein